MYLTHESLWLDPGSEHLVGRMTGVTHSLFGELPLFHPQASTLEEGLIVITLVQ